MSKISLSSSLQKQHSEAPGFDDDKENYGQTLDVDLKMKIDVIVVVEIVEIAQQSSSVLFENDRNDLSLYPFDEVWLAVRWSSLAATILLLVDHPK